MASTTTERTKDICNLVPQLSERNQELVFELMLGLLPYDPDDILTPEDLTDIAEADAEFARGEYIDLDDHIAAELAKEAARLAEERCG